MTLFDKLALVLLAACLLALLVHLVRETRSLPDTYRPVYDRGTVYIVQFERPALVRVIRFYDQEANEPQFYDWEMWWRSRYD